MAIAVGGRGGGLIVKEITHPVRVFRGYISYEGKHTAAATAAAAACSSSWWGRILGSENYQMKRLYTSLGGQT